jgi:hypothetical protein
MKPITKAVSLSLLLISPAAFGDPAPQAWQFARQHFPALQAAQPVLQVSQGSPAELNAFDQSKYTYWDAKVLADFWKQGVGETKATIGRKILWGGASVSELENNLRTARNQALGSVNQLRLYSEAFTPQDAADLARFWGEPSPIEAKMRVERKLILGDEKFVQDSLRQAHQSVPTPPVQADFLGNLVGSRWSYNYQGQALQFDFGQTSIDNFSNGFWKGISWQPSGTNQVRLWNASNRQSMNLSFHSPDSFTGNDWDGSPISGNRLGKPTFQSQTGQIHSLLPTPSQMTTTRRPHFQASFSAPPDRRSLRFVVDKMDRSQEARFAQSGGQTVLVWDPQSDLSPGNHVVEISAVGLNQETFSTLWNFSSPSPASSAPPAPTFMRVNNLRPGEILGSRFNVSGQGVPGSSILVRVEYPKQDILSQLSGVMLRFQNQGMVASDGKFSIPMDAHEVPRGQPMTITVSDSANSPIVSLKTERGADNQLQSSPGPSNGQSSTNMEKFYDRQNNFGLDIQPGWIRVPPDKNSVLKVSNQAGSSLNVGLGPAQSPQVLLGNARHQLASQGNRVNFEGATQIGGLAATRLEYSANKGPLRGVLILCVTGRNQTFLVAAESNNFNDTVVSRDIQNMLNSFLINAR